MSCEPFLREKYGVLLTVEEIAQILRLSNPKSVTNAISAGRFPIPTSKLGKRRVARVEDVAIYVDNL
jgi:hypothetical protein